SYSLPPAQTQSLPLKPSHFLCHGSWLNTTQKPYIATHTPLIPLPWLSGSTQRRSTQRHTVEAHQAQP
ncbi:unnamed protein product, partial [Ilex paraguariensis]